MGAARAAVLIVEDDAELRDWVAGELTSRDFAVERASSGPMALEVQSRRRFDLALIDLRMPGMDGIETLTALKQRDPDLEAVMATGHATVPAAVASMKRVPSTSSRSPTRCGSCSPSWSGRSRRASCRATLALHQASAALLGTHKADHLLEQAAALLKRMLRAHGRRVRPGAAEPDADVSGGADEPPGRRARGRAWRDGCRAGEAGMRLPEPGRPERRAGPVRVGHHHRAHCAERTHRRPGALPRRRSARLHRRGVPPRAGLLRPARARAGQRAAARGAGGEGPGGHPHPGRSSSSRRSSR